MEKLSRPRLKVSRPLSIVRFEHHTGEVSNLIRGVMSLRAELKHGQQTHQQPSSEHHSTKLTSINTHFRTRLVNLRERGDRLLFSKFLQRPQRQVRLNKSNQSVIWLLLLVTWPAHDPIRTEKEDFIECLDFYCEGRYIQVVEKNTRRTTEQLAVDF